MIVFSCENVQDEVEKCSNEEITDCYSANGPNKPNNIIGSPEGSGEVEFLYKYRLYHIVVIITGYLYLKKFKFYLPKNVRFLLSNQANSKDKRWPDV